LNASMVKISDSSAVCLSTRHSCLSFITLPSAWLSVPQPLPPVRVGIARPNGVPDGRGSQDSSFTAVGVSRSTEFLRLERPVRSV
jgi:hypothetical protein